MSSLSEIEENDLIRVVGVNYGWSDRLFISQLT